MTPEENQARHAVAKLLGVLVALRTAWRAARTGAPPPPARNPTTPMSAADVPANRRAETLVAAAASGRLFGFGFTAVYISRRQHPAARARDGRRAGPARRGRDRRRQARRAAGDSVEQRDVLLDEEPTEEVVWDDRVGRRGDLPPGAADRRRRGWPAPAWSPPPPRRSPRSGPKLTASTNAVAARRAPGRRTGPALPGRRDPDRRVLHGAARARRSRAARRRAARRQAAARLIHLPPARRDWAPEGILAYSKICPHAGVRDLAVPLSDLRADERGAGVHLPLPLLDVLSRRGRAADLRPGRPLAAPAAADDRRRRLPARGRAVPRGHRTVVVERPPAGVVNLVDRYAAPAPSARCARASSASARPRGSSGRCATCSPTTGRSCSGRSRSTRSSCSSSPGSTWRCSTPRATRRSSTTAPTRCSTAQQMSEAYRSVLDLSFNVPAGLLFRQTHHWAADVFIAAIVLHLMRIFFTGAYRKPRDLNYYIGLTMLMLAILEGFAGYSLVDDLLSGMGLAIAYCGGDVDPAHRRAARLPDLGRPVPRLEQLPSAPGDRPRVPDPGGARGADHHPPGDDHAPAPLPVPRARPARAQRRRHADVARLRAAFDRPAVRRRRRAVPARRPGPDQPDLAVGALSHLPLRERRAAGLVHRLADRRAATDAELRARDRRPHDHPQPVLGRRALPARRVRGHVRVALRSSAGSPATTAATICSTAPATGRSAPRSAPRSSAGW